MMIFILLLKIITLTTIVSSNSRLSNDVIPSEYNLVFQIYMEPEFKYEGIALIRILVKKETSRITLHGHTFKIHRATLSNGVQIKSITSDFNSSFIHLNLASPIQPSTYNLEMVFSAPIHTEMHGLYRTSYTINGEEFWVVSTQFEPMFVRSVFPCFDEPSFKAVFRISILHDPTYTALGNMPLESKRKWGTKWMQSTFQNTLKMSTYLIAFVVCKYNNKTITNSGKHNNITINIWTQSNFLNEVELAGELIPKMLNYFEDYFTIPYKISKLDAIVVPIMSQGAMENWGLITFSEKFLLHTGNITKKTVYNIYRPIAHELAHQWFGNLVTMEWWSDLWLKEGFATYFAKMCAVTFASELYSDDMITYRERIQVFQIDSLKSSRPLTEPITIPTWDIYDALPYEKGSLLIRMMKYLLGETNFRSGIINYLNQYAYSNTVPDDVWNSFSFPSTEKFTLKQVMESWTTQAGYPLLTVVKDKINKPGKMILRQKRFLKPPREDNSCYYIPVTVFTENDKNVSLEPVTWSICEDIEIEWKLSSKVWYILNVQVIGLYRVNYDVANWKLLTEEIKKSDSKIPDLNRICLLDDAVELALTGELEFKIAFDLLQAAMQTTDTNKWYKLMKKLSRLIDM